MSRLAVALTAIALIAATPALAVTAQTAPTQAAATPTIASPIKTLVATLETKAVLEKHLPGISTHEHYEMFKEMTLTEMVPMSQGLITPEIIAAIDTDLKALPKAR